MTARLVIPTEVGIYAALDTGLRRYDELSLDLGH